MAFKLKFRTMFPANVTAASPLTLVKTGLAYAFGLDVSALQSSLDPLYLTTNFTQSGTGAVPVSYDSIFRGVIVTPEMFGAVGNGVTDDAPAIRRALAFLGGLTLAGKLKLSPNKTYLLGSRYTAVGNGVTIFPLCSNLTVEGDGDSSVLKVAANMNTVGTQYAIFYPPDETSTYTYNNVHFRNFKIDNNGVNNSGGGTLQYQNVNFGVRFGSNLTVDNVTVINHPGSQIISFGLNNSLSTSEVTVSNCRFFEVGTATNAAVTDHSSVYLSSSNGVVSGNIVKNASQDQRSTGYEVHGLNINIFGNTAQNINKFCNVAGTLAVSAQNVAISGNTGISLCQGFGLFCDGTAFVKGLTFSSNTMRQSVQRSTQPFYDFDQAVTADGVSDITFSNNITISDVSAGTASTDPMMRLGRGANIIIADNIFKNSLGPAIGNGTFSASTSIKIDGNTIIDAGRTSTAGSRRGVLINSGTTIDRFDLSNNTIENVASTYMTIGVDVTLTATYGRIGLNNIINNVGTSIATSAAGFNIAPFNGIMYSQGLGFTPTATTALANAVLVTNGSNVPSLSTTLPNIALGTPTSVTLTNATGLPIASGVSGLGTGIAAFLATPSSANLRTAITDESGTGALLFAGGNLGAATATSINGAALDNLAWTSYTPTVTSAGGSMAATGTTITATGKYKQIGKTLFLIIKVVVTTVGTATGTMAVTLPGGFTSTNDAAAVGKEIGATGKTINGYIGASQTALDQVRFYDNTTVWASGNTALFGLTIEVN